MSSPMLMRCSGLTLSGPLALPLLSLAMACLSSEEVMVGAHSNRVMSGSSMVSVCGIGVSAGPGRARSLKYSCHPVMTSASP